MTPNEPRINLLQRSNEKSQLARLLKNKRNNAIQINTTTNNQTLCNEELFSEVGEYIDFSNLPEKYYFEWQFLRKKVDFYQDRLFRFYNMLNELALQCFENKRRRREHHPHFNFKDTREVPQIAPPFFSDESILRKRENEEFGFEKIDEQYGMQSRNFFNSRDSFYQE